MTKADIWKNFFVLEGLDGAGTTSQLKKVSKMLKKRGKEIFSTFEPTDDSIGSLIRKVLQGKTEVTPKSLAKLFVADRENHLYGAGGIQEALNAGKIVLCDRYLFSSLAYQSLDVEFDQIFELNKSFPLPEKVFFLDVNEEIAEKRRNDRESQEIFEKLDLQKRVRKNYYNALESYAGSEMEVILIDGTDTIENISSKICSHILS